MIHCALSAQHIHKFAAGSPYVYCGDFNIKPDSVMYEVMTTGGMKNPNCIENPALIQAADDKWQSVPPVRILLYYCSSFFSC
jgi:endonuclease/exonuclease/phosphatase family metal-dependent hydrolase